MKRSFLYRCLTSALVLLISVSAFAQQTEITGTVLSAANEPVIGAAIIDVATKEGVITDIDGKFTIKSNAGSVLEVSSLGYETVKTKAQNGMTVILNEAVNLVQETVVVGYTTQRKSDLTGSVTVVSVDDIKNTPAVDVMTALQGRVPGMSVSSTETLLPRQASRSAVSVPSTIQTLCTSLTVCLPLRESRTLMLLTLNPSRS